jgi:hypothetical protein
MKKKKSHVGNKRNEATLLRNKELVEVARDLVSDLEAVREWNRPKSQDDFARAVIDSIVALRASATMIEELEKALRWCGGSPDFAPGGKAHDGWNRICAPILASRAMSDAVARQRALFLGPHRAPA